MIQSLKKVSKGLGILLCTLVMALAVGVVVPMNDNQVGNTAVVQAAEKLSTTKITMTKGKTAKIKVSGTKSKVTYKTSNKKIATVSAKGVVKGVSKGSTTIKVKVGKKTYKVSVKVEKPSISKSSVSLKKGATYKLKVNATSRKVKWTSNNKKVATVSGSGKVTAKGKGQAIITAKLNDKSYTCKVIVGGHNVIVCPDSISVKYGETKKVTLTAGDSFSYSLENYSLASVNITPSYFTIGEKLTMTVTGEAVGTTYIVFKSSAGWTKKCKLTVTGTSVSASSASSTISSVKVNSVQAYKSCNTSNPEMQIKTSITNNINAKISYITLNYGLYNKSGKLIGTTYEGISNPVKGKAQSVSFKLYKSSSVNINEVASVKLLSIVANVDRALQDAINPNIKASVATTSSVSGVTVSNISAKFTYGYYYNRVESYFSYTLKNTSSQGKSVKIYYDVYDANGRKVPQEYEAYNYEFIDKGQTLNIPFANYGETLYGDLSTGGFSKVVLRVVEY